jgi:hypothetical protein
VLALNRIAIALIDSWMKDLVFMLIVVIDQMKKDNDTIDDI